MDRLNKRLAVIEAKRPKPQQLTDDALRWIQLQFIRSNLQIVAGIVIVNPTVETTPLHARVLASLARAANQAGIGRRYA